MTHPLVFVWPFAAAVLSTGLAGCERSDPGPPLVPVSGQVLLDGEPLSTGGSVSYRDPSGIVQPTGKVEPDGTYTLRLGQREGAPAGTYRVVVFATESTNEEVRGHGGLPRLIIDKKYTNPRTTPLEVEVGADAAPGAYDLEVTR